MLHLIHKELDTKMHLPWQSNLALLISHFRDKREFSKCLVIPALELQLL